MAPVINLLALAVDFDIIDALGFIPGSADHPRIEFDEWIEVVFLGKLLEVRLQWQFSNG
jgi:hypothetical protein